MLSADWGTKRPRVQKMIGRYYGPSIARFTSEPVSLMCQHLSPA
jgi:hypothetical protein